MPTPSVSTAWPETPEGLSKWIISQRPPRLAVDSLKPHGLFLEEERSTSGRIVSSACILLTNKECPWRCLMCDLWKHTLTGPTPPGAIPAQIHYALGQLGSQPDQIKLYNSGSFFDVAAIPEVDYEPIAGAISCARHIIVESHPRLIGSRTLRFRDLLPGSLEVAIGLETIHPGVLPRLNKRFDLDDFVQAAEFLRKNGIGLRAFLLVRPPFMAESEAVFWSLKSTEFAFECGASAVSLIPTRPGNGALEALARTGEFSRPALRTLEEAFEEVLKLQKGRTFADTWDLEQFSNCPACFPARKARLETMNLTQALLSRICCDRCANS